MSLSSITSSLKMRGYKAKPRIKKTWLDSLKLNNKINSVIKKNMTGRILKSQKWFKSKNY